jgi:HEAT repeat protein
MDFDGAGSDRSGSNRKRGGRLEQDLLSRLVSYDWRDRQEAIESLTALAGGKALNHLALARALVLIVRNSHNNMSALNSSMQVLEQIGQPVSEELTALLHDDDLDLRIYVPLVLGHLGGEAVVKALIEAATDLSQPENVRFNAIEALGLLHAAQAVPALLEILSNGSDFLRYGAVSALGSLGRQEAAPALESQLYDPYLSEPAVLALGTCGSVENIPAICAWLDRSPSGARVAVTAISAIARRSPERGEAQQSFKAAAGSNTRSRILALLPDSGELRCLETETSWADLAILLGWFLSLNPGDQAISEALIMLLACKPARSEAAAALANSSGPIPESLIRLVQERDTEQALAATHVIANLANPEGLPTLLSIIHAEDEALAITAIQGIGRILGQISPSQLKDVNYVIETLVDLLHNSRASIRQSAVEVLSTLHNWGIEDQAVELLNYPNPLSRASSLQLLTKMNPQAAMRAAVAARNDPAPEVRRIAIELLPRSSQPQAVDFLRQALNDTDASSRRAAAQASTELPAELALPLLVLAAQDSDRWVRLQAARGFGRALFPAALNILSKLVKDEFPPVRTAAVEAAAHFVANREWQASALEILHAAAKDEDAAVRQAAQAGLKSALTDEMSG